MTEPQSEQPHQDDQPPTDSVDSESGDQQVDEGPGCMPAVLAATVLMGIIGFVACGFSTWILFNKRSELAVRTLRATYIPEVEQSFLEPDEKQAVIKQLDEFAAGLERGEYENWQAAGVMQRMQRLPVLQWGELAAIDAVLEKSGGENADEARRQLSRLKRAVELDKATSFDFEDVLKPAAEPDVSSSLGRRLIEPLTAEAVAEVVERARLVADRAKVPDQEFADVRIDAIVRRQIEQGVRAGSF